MPTENDEQEFTEGLIASYRRLADKFGIPEERIDAGEEKIRENVRRNAGGGQETPSDGDQVTREGEHGK